MSRSIPKPNPEVYRLAAELIEQGEVYSCLAIEDAARKLRAHVDMHALQYEAMFGPWGRVEIRRVKCSFGSWYELDHIGRTDVDYDQARRSHPYWDTYSTPDRQQMRVLALLFMAEVVS